MRVTSTALLVLLISIAAFSQTRPLLQPKGEMKIDDAEDRIVTEKLLPENRLLLVGQKNIRLWDLTSAKLIASLPIDLPDITEDYARVISPDGHFMFVFGNYNSGAKRDKIKRPASVWNLQTGKQIAVFDKTSQPVRYAAWSKNRKTLVTSSEQIGVERIEPQPMEISFWDGETLQYLNTVAANNINWSDLTHDGSKFLYSVAGARNLFMLGKYFRNTGGPISVWDIKSGKVEQTIFANASDPKQGMRSISVSPDERFLMFVTQPLKSKDVERTLVVLSIGKTSSTYEFNRRYEIKPALKINDLSASFSYDGKYLALITGKVSYWSYAGGIVLQLYATEGGTKLAELREHYAPNYWLNNNQIVLFDYGSTMEAIEVATGRKLYEAKLIYDSSPITRTHSSPSVGFPGLTDRTTFNTGYHVVHERTQIVPHPSGRTFLTYSNQYVKVHDAQTGAILQTLVEPAVDTTKPVDPKNGPRLSQEPLVSKVDWYNDGNALYIVSADGKSVSLWSMN